MPPAAAAGALADLPAPPALPFFGSVLSFDARRMHHVLEDWAARYGTPYRVRLMGRDMLVVGDAASIAAVLRARPDTFRRGRPVQSVFRDMGISGVFGAEGETWARQRRLVMRAFDPAHLKDYFPGLVRVTERLRRRWEQSAGEALDIQSELMRYTVDVTAGLAFGSDINTIEGDDDIIQQHLDKIFPMVSRRLTAPFPWWRHFKLPSDRALDRDLAAIHGAIARFIAEARARIAADPSRAEKPANLIEALLAARDTPGSGFDDADVSGNVFTALLAGEDTTANTLAWLCFYLAEHPDAQEKLRAEADAALGADRMLGAVEGLNALPYAEAATREAMRLRPVAPLLFFEALEDTTVAGYALPAGGTVATLMRAPGMDASKLDDPGAFRPERWLGEAGTTERAGAAKKALMPFGGGPRFCPGRYLALAEIKMVATMLARNFTLERLPGQVSERYNLSMSPGGLRIRLAPRG
ncbi:MAG TPA: cytochrome P450 [Burkholderiales bacterium]